ncbi:PRD domain-containing protein, partial [uncultured Enterococcus sp.]|uniref:PRD domain-containing protein n=1 Tax=uncultured Enterococcus sp. TaxID=167972 RepID=UPI0025D2523E
KLLVHTAFAYERVVRKDPLVYRETWTCEQEAGSLALRKSLLFLEKGLDLYLDQDELIYIYDILTELHETVY